MRKSNQCPNGWMQTVLGKVGDVSMCKRVLKHQTANFGDVPFFKIGTFGGVPDAYISQDLFNEYKQKYSYPKNGDVLISAAGTIGRLVVFDGIDAYFQDSNIVWIANDEKIALNKYLYYLYQTIRWRTSEGGIVSRLYNAEIRKTKICLPPLEEQEKIAQILATWDSAIEQLTDLIAEKQHQKKALMQRLLTGKQRLPGFNKPWEKRLLNELFKIYKGRDLSKNLVSISGKHQCILYGEIYTKYSEVIREVVSKTDANLGVPSISGDILVPASTTTQGIDLAKASVVLEDNVLLGGDINILRKKNELSSEFFAYALTNVYNFNIAKLTQGITIVHLYPEHLKGLVLYVPELSEQKAIADVLMAADAEIDLLQQQLQAIAEQKQGLMQQLLTGKIRVKEDCNV